ncbi:MAG: PDZ domain-containing protein, partial [Oscillospiraceae bacterium]|nr:PDZ domain-containing protein [Oscillospiraceae bacterium]
MIHGGPSEKLNIKAGDKIITVNDSLVAGVGMTNEKTIKLLKGPSGTKVTVGIKRFGTEKIIPFEITRGAVPITS